jgi:hypothetical protein
MAASGAKVPLAGTNRGLPAAAGSLDGAPGVPAGSGRSAAGSLRLFLARAGGTGGATMGLSPHDGWLGAVSVQVTGG